LGLTSVEIDLHFGYLGIPRAADWAHTLQTSNGLASTFTAHHGHWFCASLDQNGRVTCDAGIFLTSYEASLAGMELVPAIETREYSFLSHIGG
jgi:hypothetical protein